MSLHSVNLFPSCLFVTHCRGHSTPGHPENFHTAGVEVSTGPLGQGISNAVGLAIAERHLAAQYNMAGEDPIIDNFTYAICGDGCLQEGVSSEASSLAGHLRLGRLIVLYDDNHITIDGGTDLSFTEDVLKRYEAYGWHCAHVPDGDSNVAGIITAIKAAQVSMLLAAQSLQGFRILTRSFVFVQAVTDAPSIIKVTTTIGFGSGLAGTGAVHGAPLKGDDLGALKTKFGFDPAKVGFL